MGSNPIPATNIPSQENSTLEEFFRQYPRTLDEDDEERLALYARVDTWPCYWCGAKSFKWCIVTKDYKTIVRGCNSCAERQEILLELGE